MSTKTPHADVLKKRKFNDLVSELWIVFVFILIYFIFVLIEPLCLSMPFWASTLNYMTEILILGVGVMFVVITGGIDLSIGPVEGCVGVLSALAIKALVPVIGTALALIAGILVGLMVGAVIGFINAFVITKMKLAPFIATLGMSVMLTGLGYTFNNGLEVVGLPTDMANLGNYQIFGFLSVTTLVAIVTCIIFGLILHKTRFGVHTYAYGSNSESTKRVGINTDRLLFKVYILCSVLAALGGMTLVFRFNTGSPLAGANVTLYAIAACIIGGTSVMGGKGKMVGTLIGSLIISILVTGLVMLGLQTYWQQVATGIIIIAAVYTDQIRRKRDLIT
jgi:ribose transport system permease protein